MLTVNQNINWTLTFALIKLRALNCLGNFIMVAPFGNRLWPYVLVISLLNTAVWADVRQAVPDELEETVVLAKRVANDTTATSAPTLATKLRYDPRVEAQSRGAPEGQADITIRGALFENTGLNFGAVTILDPQTGHYTLELPIAPAFLTEARIVTGNDNAYASLNATVGSVQYALREIETKTEFSLAVGSDGLNYQNINLAKRQPLSDGSSLALGLAAMRSEADGTVENGDHQMERYNLVLQRLSEQSQTDLILAKTNKFHAWPGMYTGFASLPETDDLQVEFLLLSHKMRLNSGDIEWAAYSRSVVDDYDFDRRTRESGGLGSFDHKTRIWGLGIHGTTAFDALSLDYALQYQSDELVYSTDLISGDFDTRNYLSARLLPNWRLDSSSGVLLMRAGFAYDYTNRDSDQLNPLFVLEWQPSASPTTIRLDYTGATQVAGYTALKSGPSGLFGGNSSLAREESEQWAVSFERDLTDGSITVSAFTRRDQNAVDWTYDRASPFARQANSVDLDAKGVELLWEQDWGAITSVLGATFIDKKSKYSAANVDASYYALNYAKQRFTAAVEWRLSDEWIVRWDNEYREQAKNPLRSSSNTAYRASFSLAWTPASSQSYRLVVDNVTDDDFEPFPGSPAVGRAISVQATWSLL